MERGPAGRGVSSRSDVLDVGRDSSWAVDRWSRLSPRQRRLLAVALVVALLAAVVVAAALWRDERRAARERAAVALTARFLDTTVLDRVTLGFRVEVHNRGPLPVRLESGRVALDGVGVLDVTLDPTSLPPGPTALVVRWGYLSCFVLPDHPPEEITASALRLRVATDDGAVRPVEVPLAGVVPDDLVAAVACPGWRPLAPRPESGGGPVAAPAWGTLRAPRPQALSGPRPQALSGPRPQALSGRSAASP